MKTIITLSITATLAFAGCGATSEGSKVDPTVHHSVRHSADAAADKLVSGTRKVR